MFVVLGKIICAGENVVEVRGIELGVIFSFFWYNKCIPLKKKGGTLINWREFLSGGLFKGMSPIT